MAPYAWFDPVLEWYTPPSDFSHGTYFGMARCGDAGDRCGYIATHCDVTRWGQFTDIKYIKEEMLKRLDVHFEKWLNP